jgi:hypothetical protein
MTASRVFRTSDHDGLVLGAALGQAALLAAALAFAATGAPGPGARVALAAGLALAMNWGSNTVSHIHLHAPLFRGEAANRAFSLFLSVLLAVPQSWWKLRHLAHHELPEARDAARVQALCARGAGELAVLLAAVTALGATAPLAFATVYAPGMLLGFLLCANQGWQEHRRSAAGVDVHARLYNRLWFNDGFHAAHHRTPEAHWTTLPARAAAGDVVSTLPPIARWLEALPALANRAAAATIDALERATLGLAFVRRYLLATHARAWSVLLRDAPAIRDVTIIGGGLFPRTALVLARLLPEARLTIIEAVPEHLELARAFLAPLMRERRDAVVFVEGRFDVDAGPGRADLVVVPLAFRGDRRRFYQRPPAPRVAVHDWIWRRAAGPTCRISFVLLKRLNLLSNLSDPSVQR